ncbi:hypothetical protein DM39_6828 [Burkholderia cenocepacia]|uniref:Uncharacterized protein n=2 Tax=Burkholderia cepacia complex TaxID=87882 RepID=A0AAN0VKR6_9BURK|nr:hypothetical protein DM39_6828 [Burkholderia cenocepacia]
MTASPTVRSRGYRDRKDREIEVLRICEKTLPIDLKRKKGVKAAASNRIEDESKPRRRRERGNSRSRGRASDKTGNKIVRITNKSFDSRVKGRNDAVNPTLLSGRVYMHHGVGHSEGIEAMDGVGAAAQKPVNVRRIVETLESGIRISQHGQASQTRSLCIRKRRGTLVPKHELRIRDYSRLPDGSVRPQCPDVFDALCGGINIEARSCQGFSCVCCAEARTGEQRTKDYLHDSSCYGTTDNWRTELPANSPSGAQLSGRCIDGADENGQRSSLLPIKKYIYPAEGFVDCNYRSQSGGSEKSRFDNS